MPGDPGKDTVVANLVLYTLGGPRATHSVDSFITHQSTTQPLPQATHLRGRLSGHQSPTEVLLHGVGSCTADPPQWLQPVLAASQPGGKSLPFIWHSHSMAVDPQLQQEGARSPHAVLGVGDYLEFQAWGSWRLCHWALQGIYYIRPHYEAQET